MMRTWIAAACLAAVGCGGVPQRREPLIVHLRNYNEAVRWQKFDTAAMNIPLLEREDFLDEHEQLADDLRIVDFEVKRLRFRHERTMARVDVQYTWHLDSRGIVHKTVTRQMWQRVGGTWLITGEHRVRGEPMPGVDEPEEEDGEPAEPPQSAGLAGQGAHIGAKQGHRTGGRREITE